MKSLKSYKQDNDQKKLKRHTVILRYIWKYSEKYLPVKDMGKCMSYNFGTCATDS